MKSKENSVKMEKKGDKLVLKINGVKVQDNYALFVKSNNTIETFLVKQKQIVDVLKGLSKSDVKLLVDSSIYAPVEKNSVEIPNIYHHFFSVGEFEIEKNHLGGYKVVESALNNELVNVNNMAKASETDVSVSN